MNVGELTVKVRITEGDALFDSLVELAELTRQQSDLALRISQLSGEIAELVKIDSGVSRPN